MVGVVYLLSHPINNDTIYTGVCIYKAIIFFCVSIEMLEHTFLLIIPQA